jgi:hypothetical protein
MSKPNRVNSQLCAADRASQKLGLSGRPTYLAHLACLTHPAYLTYTAYSATER